MFLADFHIHSNFSDGKLSIPEIVDLYGQQGFGAIAITDHLCEEEKFLGKASRYLNCSLTHATFPIYQEILKSEAVRAWDEYRMLLIPGVELTKNSILNHRSTHILALGVTEWIEADGDAVDLVHAIHKANGLAVAAHPVWTQKIEKQTFHLWDRREELQEIMDAWEVASGPYIFKKVQESKLPRLASSDMHHPKQMTSWKTTFTCEKHPEAVLEAVKKQDLGFHFYKEVNHVYHRPRSVVSVERRFWDYAMGNAVRA